MNQRERDFTVHLAQIIKEYLPEAFTGDQRTNRAWAIAQNYAGTIYRAATAAPPPDPAQPKGF